MTKFNHDCEPPYSFIDGKLVGPSGGPYEEVAPVQFSFIACREACLKAVRSVWNNESRDRAESIVHAAFDALNLQGFDYYREAVNGWQTFRDLERATRRLLKNINEFGVVTDPEFVTDVERVLDAGARTMTTAPAQDEERAAFERWLRTECFQAPPDCCKDLAWSAWKQARATAAEGWRPISTVPNTGELMMFYVPGEPIKFNRADDYHYKAYWLENATHWMPLPAAPGRDV